jgi:Na+-transporting NADH:ubiquinone oxidoreductase subunit C
MAFNKNSSSFTFIFAIIMVVAVGSLLALVSLGLKDKQVKNENDKKRIDILGAIQVDATRANAEELFSKYVTESFVINNKGQRLEGDVNAFDVDIKKDFRDKTLTEDDKNYPVYRCEKDGETLFVVPMVGKGLWGPIWGFVSIKSDYATLYGAKFDHKTETPGLGAEIKEDFFTSKFSGKSLADAGKSFEILKGGSVPSQPNQVDGITGGTITSKGVEEMMNRTFGIYMEFFKNNNGGQAALNQ